MAEEAFALSPISARASLPSEADYEAIREAFMETARGRWFLSEYGKRNRNADTTMVLDAVARIEQSLAAQKQAPANALIDSLGAIRAIVGEARASVAQALAGLDGGGTLAAAQDGARIIREVAWTLRECGADARICDLLDAQVNAIDSGHRQIAAIDRDEALAAFDVAMRRIADLAGDEAAAAPPHNNAPSQPEPAAASAPVAGNQSQQAAATGAEAPASELPEVAVAEMVRELPPEPVAAQTQSGAPAAARLEAAGADSSALVAEAAAVVDPDTAVATAAADDALAGNDAIALDPEAAQDVAVLDLVAIEMAAADFADDAPSEPAQDAFDPATAEPEYAEPTAEPSVAAPTAAQPAFAQPMPVAPAMVEPAVADSLERYDGTILAETMVTETVVATESLPPRSLGAALLARGMVATPATPVVDPLAPIRRMSQAEKIAFFS